MDQNLVASIFNSKDQIKLCLETPIPANLGSTDVTTTALAPVEQQQQQQRRNSTESNASSSAVVPSVPVYDDCLDESYLVQVSGVVAKKSQSSLVKQNYVEYQLTVSRLADGVTQQVQKRFRDIKALYNELIEISEEIALNQSVVFPDYSENWYSSGSSDPNSEFVQRRKRDLQTFFFELFRQYPILFRSTKVIEFLELKSFRSKAHSTFSMHYGSHGQESAAVEDLLVSETAMAANSAEASIYNPRTGMLQKHNESNMPHSPTSISVVGIMAFADEQKRRELYYQSAVQQHNVTVAEHQKQYQMQMEKQAQQQSIKR